MFRKRFDEARAEMKRLREEKRDAAKAERTKQALVRAERTSLRDNRRNADDTGWRQGGGHPGL